MAPTLTLADGRELELEVTGPDGGRVLVFIHGTPGGSHQLGQLARAVHARGHRLVTWSRAGYGASSRRAGRDVASETADAAAVLDHLGVETCVVAGWSGGGPHALACGALLADRVRAVTTIAGVAPYDAEGVDFLAGMGEDNLEEFGAALKGAEPLRAWLTAARPQLADVTAAEVAASLETLISEGDRASLTGEFADFLAAEFRQAVAAGVDGWFDDDLAFVHPWGFDLGDIAVPAYLWQGSEDLMVPFGHGQWLHGRIPGATAHLEAGRGHLDILLGHLDTWVEELLAAGSA
jgi:pimeloyl-ACP methyl ester carboxylesterase